MKLKIYPESEMLSLDQFVDEVLDNICSRVVGANNNSKRQALNDAAEPIERLVSCIEMSLNELASNTSATRTAYKNTDPATGILLMSKHVSKRIQDIRHFISNIRKQLEGI